MALWAGRCQGDKARTVPEIAKQNNKPTDIRIMAKLCCTRRSTPSGHASPCKWLTEVQHQHSHCGHASLCNCASDDQGRTPLNTIWPCLAVQAMRLAFKTITPMRVKNCSFIGPVFEIKFAGAFVPSFRTTNKKKLHVPAKVFTTAKALKSFHA